MTDFLVADIGGTNMRIGYSTPEGLDQNRIKRYQSSELGNEGPHAAIHDYCRQNGIKPKHAVFAVAGPMNNSLSFRFTNGPWSNRLIDFGDLQAQGMEVKLINDFAAQGYALYDLQRLDYKVIVKGSNKDNGFHYASDKETRETYSPYISPYGTWLLIGSGTGLGVSKVHHYKDELVVVSTEGGHAPVAAKNKAELKIIASVRDAYNKKRGCNLPYASYEMLTCGSALPAIFSAMTGKPAPQPSEIDAMAIAKDETAIKAHKFFAEKLGLCAATHAVGSNARAGVIMPGGVVTKMGDAFNVAAFKDAFHGPNSLGPNNFLPQVSVAIVTNDNSGVIGAHAYAQHMDLDQ